MMLISRALSGALNGNVAVIKSVLGEITDETNQGTAFAYLPLCWSIGALIAPALGGFLSHPAERYPSIFGSSPLLRQYPYLLPCLAGAGLSAMGLIAAVLFLEETLAGKGSTVSSNNDPEQRKPLMLGYIYPQKLQQARAVDAGNSKPALSPASPSILRIHGVRGIGFDSAEIGGALALSGIFGTLIAVIVFPPLERRVGTTVLFKVGMMLQVVSIFTFPLGHSIAEAGAGMVFVCNMILVTRSAPSRRALGTVNGLAQMVASASRAVGPAFATPIRCRRDVPPATRPPQIKR
ncbi:hypothetical protein FRC07_006640 [Ceratobasidium sp. 392]|nr:hypothetical protein FRC07_006640 [Ceratobasidium sp. 392]